MIKSGIINVIKPPGMTSYQVVARIKKIYGLKKVGHTGTLDPAAAGVLPICLGKATKVIPFILEEAKEYIGELTLGVITDTLDAEGKMLDKIEGWHKLSISDLEGVLAEFKGRIKQIPPMYSAVHYQGKRLYELAREGKEVEREAREVFIREIKILDFDLPVIRLKINCSRGTYIRSLAADIGKKLEFGAILSFLIRMSSGPFKLEDAYTLEEINQKREDILLPLDYPLDYEALVIKKSVEKKAFNGAPLYRGDFKEIPVELDKGTKVLIYTEEGLFVSINKIETNNPPNFLCLPLRVFSG